MKHSSLLHMAGLVMGAVVAGSVLAADQDGVFSMVGHASKPCHAFTEALTQARANDNYYEVNRYSLWLDGYLTAYNLLTPDTYDIAGGQDRKALLDRLGAYCKSKPADNFWTAVTKLTEGLHATRRTQGPKGGG
ncbi:MAG: hypothetical protein ACR2RB_18140 [Gammaproteobacteria bacterium]